MDTIPPVLGAPPKGFRAAAARYPFGARACLPDLLANFFGAISWEYSLAEKRAEPSRSWRASSFVRLVVASISPRSVNISPTFSPKGGPRFCDINTSIRNCQTLQSAWTALLDRRDHFRGLSSVWLGFLKPLSLLGKTRRFKYVVDFCTNRNVRKQVVWAWSLDR